MFAVVQMMVDDVRVDLWVGVVCHHVCLDVSRGGQWDLERHQVHYTQVRLRSDGFVLSRATDLLVHPGNKKEAKIK